MPHFLLHILSGKYKDHLGFISKIYLKIEK